MANHPNGEHTKRSSAGHASSSWRHLAANRVSVGADSSPLLLAPVLAGGTRTARRRALVCILCWDGIEVQQPVLVPEPAVVLVDLVWAGGHVGGAGTLLTARLAAGGAANPMLQKVGHLATLATPYKGDAVGAKISSRF